MKSILKTVLCSAILFGCAAAPTIAYKPSTEQKTTEEEETEGFQNFEFPPGMILRTAKPLICGEIGTTLTGIANDYKEKIVMSARQDIKMEDGSIMRTLVMMLFNNATKSYTILETLPKNESVVCILASGKVEKIDMPPIIDKTGIKS